MDALKQMLESYSEDDLQLHAEEESAIVFANLLLELQANYFELDSKSQTIKRYLGERKAQDKGIAEIVGDKRVPRCVYLYLRFLSAREIQRKRNYLFAQGQATPSVKQWKQKLRDDIRRRIKSFLQRDPSALVEKPAEECSVPVEKPTRCKRRRLQQKSVV